MAGGKVLGSGAGTVWVKPEDGGINMVSFSAGDKVPDWAAEQMGDHCFVDADEALEADDAESEGGPVSYSSMKKDELEAEVARRNDGRDADDQIVVGGNGTKADLTEALEADDAESD